MPKLTLQERKAELQQQIIRQTADLNAATGAMQMLDILIAAEQEPSADQPPATDPAPAEFPTPPSEAD